MAIDQMSNSNLARQSSVRITMLCIILFSWLLCLWGLSQELPFATGPDEPIYVERALEMAATGDMNPRWFGNPGSTTFYSLASLFALWHRISDHTLIASRELAAPLILVDDVWEYYFLGRLLSIFYLIASLPLLTKIGERAFGVREGMLGALLFVTYAVVIFHARQVRTDTAATFFGLLSLWFCLGLLERSTMRNQIAAGIAIGLAIASRYFMVALIPIYFIVQFIAIRRTRTEKHQPQIWLSALVSALTIPLSFLLVTPFFVLDFETVRQNIIFEARNVHPGYDGLAPVGNFFWYFTSALPHIAGWVQLGLFIVGVIALLRRHHREGILLLVYVALFLVLISTSALHWHRWMIQILPIIALVVAVGVTALADFGLSRFAHTSRRVRVGVNVCLVLLALAWPLYRTVLLDIRQATKSTRIEAREWVIANLPADAHIAEEAYTAPLDDLGYTVEWRFSLAEHNLNEYITQGVNYAIVSNKIFNRYLDAPQRYPDEVAFYEQLFVDGTLLKRIEPDYTQNGSTILIYRID